MFPFSETGLQGGTVYAANGIVLNGSEFETLRVLDESDNPESVANRLLDGDEDKYREVMVGLRNAGLISGTPVSGGFVFIRLNEAGRAFLRDYDAEAEAEREAEASREREERRRLWSDRRFQVGLSIGTAIASAALSVLASVMTNLVMNGGL